MMKRLFLCIFLLMSMASFSYAELDIQIDQPELFKKFNPDGKKYRFVKDYVKSLEFLIYISELNAYINEEVKEKDKIEQVEALRHNFIQNNVQLRIARNYLNQHNDSPENGLMLLAVEQFERVCNNLIDLNNQERALMERYYAYLYQDKAEEFDRADFEHQREGIQEQRKQASGLLLETSVLVTKIMLSDEENYFGEFDMLGFTQEERYKLLRRLDKFTGRQFDGDPRAGQTFLEASIAVLRGVLENFSYTTLDG